MRRVIGFLVLGGAVTALLIRRLISPRRAARASVAPPPRNEASIAAALVYQRGRDIIERAHAELRARALRLPFSRTF